MWGAKLNSPGLALEALERSGNWSLCQGGLCWPDHCSFEVQTVCSHCSGMVLAVGQWVILGDKFSAAAETPSCGNISKLS